jgi:hypothetical protein
VSPVDLVKQHRALYNPSYKHPAILDVPERSFLAVDGRGAPESDVYADALQALYGTAYTLKFAVRNKDAERDFKVAPLEGLWWGDAERPSLADLQGDRDSWNWRMMIAVPDDVTEDEAAAAFEAAARKHRPASPVEVRFERFTEGLAAQLMHIGPYSEEGPTIERLHAWVAEQGYVLRDRHHEVYLGDPRRTAPERLKTVIRHPVKEA